MSLADPLSILPFTQPATGEVDLPGSKSITNRALILAALAVGATTLQGALFSRDSRIMIAALQALGFTVRADETAQTIVVEGRGGQIPASAAKIDVGNAGTAARFLTALVALHPHGVYQFAGDQAMCKRPIRPLLDALATQGTSTDRDHFPFTLKTTGLRGGNVSIDASESSQLFSALLLVAPHARTPLHVTLSGETVSKPFVTMTREMVRQFAQPRSDYPVEGDASAASYFAALSVVTRSTLRINGLHLATDALQGDAEFFHLLSRHRLLAIDGLTIRAGAQREGLTVDFNAFSDTFLTLAAIAPLLQGPTKITGIAHTRKQETDRVAGMARELRKLGQRVIENKDSLEIHPQPLKAGVVIETYEDHRFAMSFGVLGCHDLHGNGEPWLSIKDPHCCAKTFPNFFQVLADLCPTSTA